MYNQNVNDTKMKDKVRFYIGSYRHAQPRPSDNVYARVRKHLGLSQNKAAALFGISQRAWHYRERTKRMYHIAEINALRIASGMSDSEWIKLLNDVA